MILGAARIREILKSREYLWKRTRQSNKSEQNEKNKIRKQAHFEMLQLATTCGEMRIKYVDESGCEWLVKCALHLGKKGGAKMYIPDERPTEKNNYFRGVPARREF